MELCPLFARGVSLELSSSLQYVLGVEVSRAG